MIENKKDLYDEIERIVYNEDNKSSDVVTDRIIFVVEEYFSFEEKVLMDYLASMRRLTRSL